MNRPNINNRKYHYLGLAFLRIFNTLFMIFMTYLAAMKADYGRSDLGQFACIAWIYVVTIALEIFSFRLVFHQPDSEPHNGDE